MLQHLPRPAMLGLKKVTGSSVEWVCLLPSLKYNHLTQWLSQDIYKKLCYSSYDSSKLAHGCEEQGPQAIGLCLTAWKSSFSSSPSPSSSLSSFLPVGINIAVELESSCRDFTQNRKESILLDNIKSKDRQDSWQYTHRKNIPTNRTYIWGCVRVYIHKISQTLTTFRGQALNHIHFYVTNTMPGM